MTIRWLGHSCFELVTGAGTVVVTDPFDESVGYPRPGVKADLVTMSHDHHDHNCLAALEGEPEVAPRRGEASFRDVTVRAIPTFHDEVQGRRRGENVVYRIEADGKTVVHLGDLGHMLSPEQLREVGRPDVLLIPVGGVFTIDGTRAAQLALAIGARTTVAMHFNTPMLSFELRDEQDFLRGMNRQAARLNQFAVNEEAPALIVPVL